MRDANSRHTKSTDFLTVTRPADTTKLPFATNPAGSGKIARPSREEIARTAYFIYLNQGCRHGQDTQHWLTAEAELNGSRKPNRLLV